MNAGRDNHFNLLRIALAAGVLLCHCFPLTRGWHGYAGEPWFDFTGGQRLLGVTCVLGFFVISGYLVSESFERAAGLKAYFAARVLRIYPAAIACALMSGLLLGPLVTHDTAVAYFGSPGLRHFLFNTMTFFSLSLSDVIPGTFPGNPVQNTMNGSLWTISWELLCYLVLVPFGLLLYRSRAPWVRVATYGVLLLLIAAGSIQYAVRPLPSNHFAGLLTFWSFFSIGIVGRALFRRLPRSGWLTLGALAAFLLIERFEQHAPAIAIASPLLFGYILLNAATQLPVGWLAFNRLGDFSYGLYLYAWPMQQALVYAFPGIGPWSLFALATPLALGLAVPSWRLLEKPALRFKARFANAANRNASGTTTARDGGAPAHAGISAA